MKAFRLVVLLSAIAALFCATRAAQAGGPYAGCHGIPFYYPFYAQYGREHIPYFALHPPVYYSYPVPRAYGFSPFAYPFGSPTPELHMLPPQSADPFEPVEPPKPKMTRNPYVPAAPSDREARVEPKVIYNPFVSETRLASGG